MLEKTEGQPRLDYQEKQGATKTGLSGKTSTIANKTQHITQKPNKMTIMDPTKHDKQSHFL